MARIIGSLDECSLYWSKSLSPSSSKWDVNCLRRPEAIAEGFEKREQKGGRDRMRGGRRGRKGRKEGIREEDRG